MEMSGIHITPLQSLEMGGPSSKLLQLLIYFSIIKSTTTFITKVCLLVPALQCSLGVLLPLLMPEATGEAWWLKEQSGWISQLSNIRFQVNLQSAEGWIVLQLISWL